MFFIFISNAETFVSVATIETLFSVLSVTHCSISETVSDLEGNGNHQSCSIHETVVYSSEFICLKHITADEMCLRCFILVLFLNRVPPI